MKIENKKKFISILLTILFSFVGVFQIKEYTAFGASQYPTDTTNVTGISLDKTLINMALNQTIYLSATVFPSTASNKNVVWQSANSNIVQVNQNGLLTAKSEGAVLITARTYDGGFIATCTVIVKNAPVTGVSLDKSNLLLNKGNAAILKASIAPKNASNKSVEWFSSNSNIASVDSNGVVIGKSQGSAYITVKTKDGGFTSICTVKVSNIDVNIPVTGITLNKFFILLDKGDTEKLIPTVLPSKASNKQVLWSSDNLEVATIDAEGKVTALKPGLALITARTMDGGFTSRSCVIVRENHDDDDEDNEDDKPLVIKGIRLNKTSTSIKEGKFKQLTPIFTPGNTKNKSVTWKTSDAKIATVTANGRVFGLKEGKAVITVTTADGKYSAKCTVTVLKNKDNGKGKDKDKKNWKWD